MNSWVDSRIHLKSQILLQGVQEKQERTQDTELMKKLPQIFTKQTTYCQK